METAEPGVVVVVDPDAVAVTAFRWMPAGVPRAVVHVLHGWAEHARRYDRLAAALVAEGYAVWADDHRGHGRTGLASGGLGEMGPGGQDGVLQSVRAVSEEARRGHPDLPLVVLGHSWGSFLAQRYIRHWGQELAAVVLTGTTALGARGGRGGDFNAAFEPARTAYDWLSRDEAEVDRYVADPLCGFERMTQARNEMSHASARLPERTDADVPASLPILILNGGDDPVGGAEGGEALAARYREAGVRDVTLRVYPGARHELFNELERERVTADLLEWLGRRVPSAGAA